MAVAAAMVPLRWVLAFGLFWGTGVVTSWLDGDDGSPWIRWAVAHFDALRDALQGDLLTLQRQMGSEYWNLGSIQAA